MKYERFFFKNLDVLSFFIDLCITLHKPNSSFVWNFASWENLNLKRDCHGETQLLNTDITRPVKKHIDAPHPNTAEKHKNKLLHTL